MKPSWQIGGGNESSFFGLSLLVDRSHHECSSGVAVDFLQKNERKISKFGLQKTREKCDW